MIKKIISTYSIAIALTHTLCAQSLPVPDHIVIVMEENHAYEEIMGDSSAAAPYINSLPSDTDAALFTQYYALDHPSQPNYLMLFSGSDQNVNGDDIPTTPFTDCNLGASLLTNNYTFMGYSESEPSVGYLGDTYGTTYVRRHAPWANWQGASTNAIPDSCNAPYTSFPTDYNLLPTVSFVIPNLNDDMHNGTISEGDTWLKNNLPNYIAWAKTHNSLFVLTFDEDDNYHNNHIVTIFIGQMVKGGTYSDTTIHYDLLRTIESIYGLTTDCGYSDSTNAAITITKCWKEVSTRVNQLSVNGDQLSIYPNPTTGFINITDPNKIGEIKVTNLLGQLIYEAQPNQKNYSFEIKDAGIYFVTVVTGNKIETQKIVVSK